MGLMSLWDWDGVLYSMASHCCFQQTVHHYSIWQESKHCAFRGQEKARPPLFVKSLHPASLCCFISSHIFTLPLVSPCYFTTFSVQAPAQWRVDVHLTHALVTMEAFQLLGGRQIFVSMSSSLQSGSVWHEVCLFPRLAQRKWVVLYYYFTTHASFP